MTSAAANGPALRDRPPGSSIAVAASGFGDRLGGVLYNKENPIPGPGGVVSLKSRPPHDEHHGSRSPSLLKKTVVASGSSWAASSRGPGRSDLVQSALSVLRLLRRI